MNQERAFATLAGRPMIVEVEGMDGATYEVRLAIAVLAVTATGKLLPNGMPELHFAVQLVTQTDRKAPEPTVSSPGAGAFSVRDLASEG